MKKIISKNEIGIISKALDIKRRIEERVNQISEYDITPTNPEKCKEAIRELFEIAGIFHDAGMDNAFRFNIPFWVSRDEMTCNRLIDEMAAFKSDFEKAIAEDPGIAYKIYPNHSYFALCSPSNHDLTIFDGHLVIIRRCKMSDRKKLKKMLKLGGFSCKRYKYDSQYRRYDDIGYEICRESSFQKPRELI